MLLLMYYYKLIIYIQKYTCSKKYFFKSLRTKIYMQQKVLFNSLGIYS